MKHLFSVRSLSQKRSDHVGHDSLSETPRPGNTSISLIICIGGLQNFIKKPRLVYKKSG